MKEKIKTIIREYLGENIQLADKYYFNHGKLSNEDRNKILKITNGDNYTKIITDFYYLIKEHPFAYKHKIEDLYEEVKNYNKNLFPIKDYNVFKVQNPSVVLDSIILREKIIKYLNALPSIAKRNMKNDIRQERNITELMDYEHKLGYFIANYSQLYNRSPEIQYQFARKMFKNNTTIEDLMSFVDDKEEFIGGEDFTREKIKELSQTEDLSIIYDHNNIMIVEVYSGEAIKKIGCNSLLCFTYGEDYNRQWSRYSYNNKVYVIINLNVPNDSLDFMFVLISPLVNDDGDLYTYDEDNEDDIPLFNMANENYYNPYDILKNLFGDSYEKIIREYLNFY